MRGKVWEVVAAYNLYDNSNLIFVLKQWQYFNALMPLSSAIVQKSLHFHWLFQLYIELSHRHLQMQVVFHMKSG